MAAAFRDGAADLGDPMVDHDALLRTYEHYAKALLGEQPIGDLLYRLVDQVVDVLGVDGAAVSVAEDGEPLSLVAATDGAVAGVEARQLEAGRGPCWEAFEAGDPVVVDDLASETRWDDWCELARNAGFSAVAGIPMPVAERRIGALDLYHRAVHAWTSEELRVAQVLADTASGYIVNTTELTRSRTLADQLQRALDSRVIVEQAKGVLVERRGVSPDEAFGVLRTYARSHSMRLHEVCRQVVEEQLRP